MSLAVSDFKAKLTGGGARPNLFKCIINSPTVTSGVDSELASFMCKGGSLPASEVSSITVPFRGREVKVAGDRTFADWTATIINDTDFALRNAFERWLNAINAHASGIAESTTPTSYTADIEIQQLDRAGAVIKRYIIVGAFPVSMSDIPLAFDSTNSIEEFTVNFAYQYWTSDTTS